MVAQFQINTALCPAQDRSDRVTSSPSPQWRRVRSSMTQGTPKSSYGSYSRSGRNPVTHHRGWKVTKVRRTNFLQSYYRNDPMKSLYDSSCVRLLLLFEVSNQREDRSDRVTSSPSPQWRRVRSSMTQGTPKSSYGSYSRSGRNPVTHHRGWKVTKVRRTNFAIIL
ncbi:hypothetical protein TNCV_434061 [Trichonephila clavipes]|nr:hypothetical protein TNCV_434061 [Trichonephila clavipes]